MVWAIGLLLSLLAMAGLVNVRLGRRRRERSLARVDRRRRRIARDRLWTALFFRQRQKRIGYQPELEQQGSS